MNGRRGTALVAAVALAAAGVVVAVASGGAAYAAPDEGDGPIPVWVKGVFAFYIDGHITDDELISALEFLIAQDIIQVTTGIEQDDDRPPARAPAGRPTDAERAEGEAIHAAAAGRGATAVAADIAYQKARDKTVDAQDHALTAGDAAAAAAAKAAAAAWNDYLGADIDSDDVYLEYYEAIQDARGVAQPSHSDMSIYHRAIIARDAAIPYAEASLAADARIAAADKYSPATYAALADTAAAIATTRGAHADESEAWSEWFDNRAKRNAAAAAAFNALGREGAGAYTTQYHVTSKYAAAAAAWEDAAEAAEVGAALARTAAEAGDVAASAYFAASKTSIECPASICR